MNASVRTFEETRRIPGFPSYCVSESGAVFRIGRDRPLTPCKAKRGGYLVVSLWEGGKGRTRPVHQLVTAAFHGARPSPKHDAAHWDGDRTNNRSTNLRWATRAQNEADKLRHGRSNRGERNGSAKLTDMQAAEIKARARFLPLSSGGVRLRKGALAALAAEYGITASAAWQIIDGRRRVAS